MGTCVAFELEMSPCESDIHCQPGSMCDSLSSGTSTAQRICVTPFTRKLGQSCGKSLHCQMGLACSKDYTCIAPQPMTPCDETYANQWCPFGSSCECPQSQPTPQCSQLPPLKGTCASRNADATACLRQFALHWTYIDMFALNDPSANTVGSNNCVQEIGSLACDPECNALGWKSEFREYFNCNTTPPALSPFKHGISGCTSCPAAEPQPAPHKREDDEDSGGNPVGPVTTAAIVIVVLLVVALIVVGVYRFYARRPKDQTPIDDDYVLQGVTQ